MSIPTNLKISLAQWSFHNTIQAGKLLKLDFAQKARLMGFEAVEYVSRFYAEEATNTATFKHLIQEIKLRSTSEGLKNLLIMVDNEGELASPDVATRKTGIENHKKWVDAAAELGCHSLRVNLNGCPDDDALWLASATQSLEALADYAKGSNLNIIVENHGDQSSNGALMATLMQNINRSNVGTLPDFGNFCIRRKDGLRFPSPCLDLYDRYTGTAELMPFAKGVSAKSYDFDENGNETTIDYHRILEIVFKSGYSGYIGIEYEGQRLSEEEGIIATRQLVEKIYSEFCTL